MGEHTLLLKARPQNCTYAELRLTAIPSHKGHWESSLNFRWPHAQLISHSPWKERRLKMGNSSSLSPVSLQLKQTFSCLSISVVEIWGMTSRNGLILCVLLFYQKCAMPSYPFCLDWASLPLPGFALSDMLGLDGNLIQMDAAINVPMVVTPYAAGSGVHFWSMRSGRP